jgi:hypothetical protein
VPDLLGFQGRLANLCGLATLPAKPLHQPRIRRSLMFVSSGNGEKIVLPQLGGRRELSVAPPVCFVEAKGAPR